MRAWLKRWWKRCIIDDAPVDVVEGVSWLDRVNGVGVRA